MSRWTTATIAICLLAWAAACPAEDTVVTATSSPVAGARIHVVAPGQGASTRPQADVFWARDPSRAYWLYEGLAGAKAKKEKAAYLGVTVSPLTGPLRKQLELPAGVGLLVDYVDPDGPARAGGLQRHDVLHKLNEQILINSHQLAVLVRTFKPGTAVTLTVVRKAKPVGLEVKLVEKELPPLPAPLWSGRTPTLPFATLPRSWGFYETKVRPRDVKLSLPIIGFDVTIADLDGKRNIVVKDTEGKVVFEGPLDSDEALQKVPSGVLREIQNLQATAMLSALMAGNGRVRYFSYTDGEHTLRLSARGDQSYLLAKDASGKVVFEGPVQTPEQRKAVPQEVLKKLARMEQLSKRGPLLRLPAPKVPARPAQPAPPGGAM